MVSTAKVAQFLQGLDFPCTKQQCIDYARRNNAPDDVMDVLHRLPDRQYFSMAGIWDAIGELQ